MKDCLYVVTPGKIGDDVVCFIDYIDNHREHIPWAPIETINARIQNKVNEYLLKKRLEKIKKILNGK